MSNQSSQPTNVGSNDQLGLVTERAAFEAWAAQRWGTEAYRHTSATSGEWDAWRAAACVEREEMAREQLDCVRQALPEEWRDGVPSVAVATLTAELELLRKEAAKSERRAIAFGDIVQQQVIAMRAAVVAAKLDGLDVGMQWIANTLCGPGNLPDLEEAKALGGAQALWDKETAEHEAFRAAHPAP